jgi:hypothetical protein
LNKSGESGHAWLILSFSGWKCFHFFYT